MDLIKKERHEETVTRPFETFTCTLCGFSIEGRTNENHEYRVLRHIYEKHVPLKVVPDRASEQEHQLLFIESKELFAAAVDAVTGPYSYRANGAFIEKGWYVHKVTYEYEDGERIPEHTLTLASIWASDMETEAAILIGLARDVRAAIE